MTFKERYQYHPQNDLLGEGAFAKVYRAYDRLLERTVALKFYKGGDTQYDLIREIKQVLELGLHHPNLVRYYDVTMINVTDFHGFQQQQQVGILAYINGNEYLNKGSDLKAFFQQYPAQQLPKKQLKAILLGILKGLQYLHNRQIVHRDFKPANILMHLKNNGRWIPKIGDFGLMKDLVNTASTSHGLKGTLKYMAPEQFFLNKYGNGQIGTNADLWAFGAMIYELFTGVPPIIRQNSGSSIPELIAQVDHFFPEQLHLETLPQPYQQIVARCLVKQASERVQQAQELIAILEGSVQEKIILSPPIALEETILSPPEKTIFKPAKKVKQDRISPSILSHPIRPIKKTEINNKFNALKSAAALGIIVLLIGMIVYPMFRAVITSAIPKNKEATVADIAPNVSPTPATFSLNKINNNLSEKEEFEEEEEVEEEVEGEFKEEVEGEFKEEVEGEFKEEEVTLIADYINYLGMGNLSAAFALQRLDANFTFYASEKGYGGVTKTELRETNIRRRNESGTQIYVKYLSVDSLNDRKPKIVSSKGIRLQCTQDGIIYEEIFTVRKINGKWLITNKEFLNFYCAHPSDFNPPTTPSTIPSTTFSTTPSSQVKTEVALSNEEVVIMDYIHHLGNNELPAALCLTTVRNQSCALLFYGRIWRNHPNSRLRD